MKARSPNLKFAKSVQNQGCLEAYRAPLTIHEYADHSDCSAPLPSKHYIRLKLSSPPPGRTQQLSLSGQWLPSRVPRRPVPRFGLTRFPQDFIPGLFPGLRSFPWLVSNSHYNFNYEYWWSRLRDLSSNTCASKPYIKCPKLFAAALTYHEVFNRTWHHLRSAQSFSCGGGRK